MSHNNTSSPKKSQSSKSAGAPLQMNASTQNTNEHPTQITKADLDDSLTRIYEKLADKIQYELQKTTSTLTQEIASLGGRTDVLETKHDKLSLAHNDLRKDFELLAENYSYLQSQVKIWTIETAETT